MARAPPTATTFTASTRLRGIRATTTAVTAGRKMMTVSNGRPRHQVALASIQASTATDPAAMPRA